MTLPTVLLVEPHFVLRRTIGAVARDLNIAEIREATSVESGIAILSGNAFDLIVLDVSLEDPAIRLLGRLRGGELISRAGTPVIALTTREPDSLGARLVGCGLEGVMRKPLKVGALLEMMRAQLDDLAVITVAG